MAFQWNFDSNCSNNRLTMIAGVAMEFHCSFETSSLFEKDCKRLVVEVEQSCKLMVHCLHSCSFVMDLTAVEAAMVDNC